MPKRHTKIHRQIFTLNDQLNALGVTIPLYAVKHATVDRFREAEMWVSAEMYSVKYNTEPPTVPEWLRPWIERSVS